MRTSRTRRALGAAIAVLALVGTGCAGNDDAEADPDASVSPSEQSTEPAAAAAVSVSATDYAFAGPASISGGLRALIVANEGAEPHHMQLMKLNDGETIETFGAAAAESEGAAMAKVSFVGGPGQVAPGASATAYVDLAPGDYLLGCFIPSEDGVPHMAKGMLSPLTVTEAEEVSTVEVASTVSAFDFGFDAPETLEAGATFAFTNDGAEVHEANIIALEGDATVQDALAWLQAEEKPGPPPFAPAGGVNAISFGGSLTAWGQAPDTAGSYAFVCFVPSPSDETPHLFKGMVWAFSVT